FFGIGSKLAKVRVEKKQTALKETVEKLIEAEPEEKVIVKQDQPIKKKSHNQRATIEEKERDKPKKQKTRRREPRNIQRGNASICERPADLNEVFDAPALDFLKDVIERMGINVSLKAFANENSLYFEIKGPDSGTVIGKRGQTLDSIQYLTSLVANKNKDKYIRVIVDAENYRSKRERTLIQLANRLGDKVQKSGKSVRLEPMNPYERKVIHATLQKNSAVTTRSEGEDPYRRIIIERR
ncbi:MAG TPA: RNA-binding cell elongation regulator Jag/EloR, partial [Anaerovoracaceae bacterium]|nr:RNA-binding cell elongation regulator Jag/EloR [Anaerovoracaceae bacterium]